MAEQKAVNVTLLDASPKLSLEVGSVHGKVRTFMDTIAVTAASFDADGDYIIMAEVPSNAKIQSIKFYNDDFDTGTTSVVNCGIYNGRTPYTIAGTTTAADALVSESCYASAITTTQAANTTGVELAFEARNINAVNNYVWEDAGLTEDPKVPLRIGLTQTATVAGAQAADFTMVVQYTVE